MKKPGFLHADTNSLKWKFGWKNIGMGMVINGCAHSGSGCWNLKLAVSHKEINGVN